MEWVKSRDYENTYTLFDKQGNHRAGVILDNINKEWWYCIFAPSCPTLKGYEPTKEKAQFRVLEHLVKQSKELLNEAQANHNAIKKLWAEVNQVFTAKN